MILSSLIVIIQYTTKNERISRELLHIPYEKRPQRTGMFKSRYLKTNENGWNSKTKSRNGYIIGVIVDEDIPEGLMEPDF